MNLPARLELGLHRRDETSYHMEMRFWSPGSAAETWLTGSSPASFQLDLQELRTNHQDAHAYGQILARSLFQAPAARSGFAMARASAASFGEPLRLRLLIGPSAPELHGLRWETLLDPEHLAPVCTDENILFSRYSGSQNLQPYRPSERDTLHALGMIASPSDLSDALPPIRVEDELERARSGMEGIELEMLYGPGKATFDSLLDGLQRGEVDLLYLVAHGGIVAKGPGEGGPQSFILLEKPNGTIQPVLAADLVVRLAEMQHLPFLAVLVSCHSAGEGSMPDSNPLLALGPRLVACGIPAVLAMHGSVSFATIAQFMPVFFRELQRDGQIDRAVSVARSRVRQAGDWWMPVLFSRLDDNRLFEVSAASKPLELQFFEPETVYVRAGSFLMGRNPALNVPAWECPQHMVELPAYRIGKFPITHRQFAEYVRQSGRLASPELGWNGQNPPDELLDQPVTGVTWVQAVAYCQWLSEKTGRRYSLPTEAQWEKAARGTKGWLYPWGDQWLEGTVFADLPPGPFGCVGMAGGVREWTLSLWGEKRATPDPKYLYPVRDDGRNDPQANLQIRRIFRGGQDESPERMTCTARGSSTPDQPGIPGKRFGFRVALSI